MRRSHVLDLPRELLVLGQDVRFYSHVPRKRAGQFGLPHQCHRGRLPWVLPLVVARSKGPGAWTSHFDAMLQRAVDRVVAGLLEPCDVFIGMSGLCVHSAQAARAKYCAKIIVKRGSRHILSQKEILEAIPGMNRPAVPEFSIRRESWGYDFADLVSIPSRHVERSCLGTWFPKRKIIPQSLRGGLNDVSTHTQAAKQSADQPRRLSIAGTQFGLASKKRRVKSSHLVNCFWLRSQLGTGN